MTTDLKHEQAVKLVYCSPASELIDIQTQGVLCLSDPEFNGMNQQEEEW